MRFSRNRVGMRIERFRLRFSNCKALKSQDECHLLYLSSWSALHPAVYSWVSTRETGLVLQVHAWP